jgi:myo-inositol 2-dehydrogenase/D-chiro-inositol 1-dehydrogenase
MTTPARNRDGATRPAEADPVRRILVAGGLAAAAGMAAGARPALAGDAPGEPRRKVKIGLVGCGSRGRWIAGLFRKHGGYDLHAVGDYFPEAARKAGEELGVDAARCFSGLSAYRKVIGSDVEAVILKTPPCFIPVHAKAAAEAGCHVYTAKPCGVDVPGALAMLELGRKGTTRQRCVFIDYQMVTDPSNIEVRKRVLEGAIGDLLQVVTIGTSSGCGDPPKGATLADRLQGLVWVNDIALGADYIGNFDIHALDAARWALGRRPVAAIGVSRLVRPAPHGDSRDVCSVVYEYEDGLVHNHLCQAYAAPAELSCRLFGTKGSAFINYWGDAWVKDPGGKAVFTGKVDNLYEAGASRNVATFHRNITGGRFENETVPRAVDGLLATSLGRVAAARKARLTMEELLRENRRCEVDVTGLTP